MSELPPAGWNADPDDPSQYRYWDGRQWTEHRAPKSGDQPPPPGPNPDSTTNAPVDADGKPWWKKWWGIALIAVVVFAVLGTCAEDGEETAIERATDTTEEGTPPNEQPAEEVITPVETTPPEEIAEQQTEEPAEEITEAPAGPAFETVTASGTGDDVVDIDVPEDQPAIVTLTHQGGANFAVWGYGPNGEQRDLLANVVGNYNGIRLLNVSGTEPTTQLEITGDGPWTVEVKPLSEAPRVSGTSYEGTGPAVFLVLDVDASSAQITHGGAANFAVWAYGESTDLLVNEIGNYSGRVRLSPNTVVIDVEADGAWTFDFS